MKRTSIPHMKNKTAEEELLGLVSCLLTTSQASAVTVFAFDA
jgi:hypothetical protein